MREYLAALKRLKRSTESLNEALQNYADALDPQAPTIDNKITMESTAEEVDEWLQQN